MALIAWLRLTGHDDRSILVQPFEKVLLEGVVVEGAVDIRRADGGIRHADFVEVSFALVLALVPTLGVYRVALVRFWGFPEGVIIRRGRKERHDGVTWPLFVSFCGMCFVAGRRGGMYSV